MPSIKLAKHVGFCSGVRRAIKIAEEALSQNDSIIYSLGQIIHNPQVIQKLEKKNLRIVDSLDNLKDRSIVILPSHGSPKHILNTAKQKKMKLIDVTCPYVLSVQKICSKLSKEKFKVIIIGDKKHPEIKALMDLAPGAFIIEKIEEIKENAFSYDKIGIISQTTQSRDEFFRIIGELLRKNSLVKEVCIFNTICLDTVNRQEEVKMLAEEVDVLLVVGSSLSANTKRLFSIGSKINKRTYLIENDKVALNDILKKVSSVGLISGASSPDWLVKNIIKKIKER